MVWGTVLTTLFSNLLVPGFYAARVLDIRPRRFLVRTLSARPPGAWRWSRRPRPCAAWPLAPTPGGGLSLLRWLPLAAHLAVGCLAAPAGRADLIEVAGKLRRRAAGRNPG